MCEKIPLNQKGAVYDKTNGTIRVAQLSVPEPDSDEILVKVLYSGVCHSDLHVWRGELPSYMVVKHPLVGGHEGAGIVVKIGSNVKNYGLGDKVGITCMSYLCGSCEYCLKGFESSCPNNKFTGVAIDGTFQQYAVVKARQAIRIPDGVDMAQVAPIFCAGLTAYRGLKETNIIAGESIAIIGSGGGLGTLAIQYAKALGYQVFGIDAAEKRQACIELGVDTFIDTSSPAEISKKIIQLSGGGVHAVLNVASNPAAMEASLTYLRPRGTAVLIAISTDSMKIDLFSSVMKAITIKGSAVGNRQDAIEALNFFSRGQVKVPIKVYKLEDLPKIFEDLEKGKIVGRAVLDLWK